MCGELHGPSSDLARGSGVSLLQWTLYSVVRAPQNLVWVPLPPRNHVLVLSFPKHGPCPKV